MNPRLDGVLFGGKAEGVVAHGMQDIEALHALVAGKNIRCDIAQGMAYVQA